MGFEIITKHQDLIYDEEGEAKMIQLLKHIITGLDNNRSFINFCTTFIIVQNMGAK